MRLPLIVLFGLIATGCGGNNSGGTNITSIPLPTDTLLNLPCENAGIWPDPCVADDPENPYRTAVIREFDVNNPDADTKFDLEAEIPEGRTGAKARFYLWATALARRGSGENQYYTARALHELYNFNDDPVIQEQALRAYRSVLDNFFGSATFFECCANLDPNGEPVPFAQPLNELTADSLYRTEATGWQRLIPGDPLLTLSVLSDWQYCYVPANPPLYNDGVLSVCDP
jgi:hypothetical protein